MKTCSIHLELAYDSQKCPACKLETKCDDLKAELTEAQQDIKDLIRDNDRLVDDLEWYKKEEINRKERN